MEVNASEKVRGRPMVLVRLSQDMMDWLRREAAENKRSMGSEVAYRLEAMRREQARAQGCVQ